MKVEIYRNKAEIDEVMFAKAHLCTSCIVCGDSIPLESNEEEAYLHGLYAHNKICDKCKAAILYVREQMKQKEN